VFHSNTYIYCQMSLSYLHNVNTLCLQDGILKRIEEKKNELDSSEHQMTNVNLSHIDERERHLVRHPLSVVV